MEKEEHIKYGPDSTSRMEKERMIEKERERNGEWRKRGGRREREEMAATKRRVQEAAESKTEEEEHNVNKTAYLWFLTSAVTCMRPVCYKSTSVTPQPIKFNCLRAHQGNINNCAQTNGEIPKQRLSIIW